MLIPPVIFYPCSTEVLLNKKAFSHTLERCYDLIKKEKSNGLNSVKIVLDKDDSSHRLPILVSFTVISDDERRLRSDIPNDAEFHIFVNDEELSQVKQYDVVKLIKQFLRIIKAINVFEQYLTEFDLL